MPAIKHLMKMAKSIVSKEWRTVVPVAVRRHLNLTEGDTLAWIVDGKSVRIVALPPNPIQALRRSARGGELHAALMRERRRERGDQNH